MITTRESGSWKRRSSNLTWMVVAWIMVWLLLMATAACQPYGGNSNYGREQHNAFVQRQWQSFDRHVEANLGPQSVGK